MASRDTASQASAAVVPSRASTQLQHQVTRIRHRALDLRPSRRLRPVAAAMQAQADALAEQLEEIRHQSYLLDAADPAPSLPAPRPAQSPRRGATLSSTIGAMVADSAAARGLGVEQ